MPAPYKIAVSTLVVIHTPRLAVLLLERADHPGFWQSVTGSQHEGVRARPAGYLHRGGQSVFGWAARKGERRPAEDVEREGEPDRALADLEIVHR